MSLGYLVRLCLKKKNGEGFGVVTQWQRACLLYMRPWIHPPMRWRCCWWYAILLSTYLVPYNLHVLTHLLFIVTVGRGHSYEESSKDQRPAINTLTKALRVSSASLRWLNNLSWVFTVGLMFPMILHWSFTVYFTVKEREDLGLEWRLNS